MDNRCEIKHYFVNIKAFTDFLRKKELLNGRNIRTITIHVYIQPYRSRNPIASNHSSRKASRLAHALSVSRKHNHC